MRKSIGRRTFLKETGVFGAAAAILSNAPALAGVSRRVHTRAGDSSISSSSLPIEHIIVDSQENHSFDNYYGFAPLVLGSSYGYGVPSTYAQPNGQGGFVIPYHFTSLSEPDIAHSWTAMHREYNGGKMDGFYTTDGINCMGSSALARIDPALLVRNGPPAMLQRTRTWRPRTENS